MRYTRSAVPLETREEPCDWIDDAWHVVQGDLPWRAAAVLSWGG
jgi:hypothetical protein